MWGRGMKQKIPLTDIPLTESFFLGFGVSVVFRLSDFGFQVKSGGLAGTRTPDQCLKRALLYRLSYQPNGGQENKGKPP